MAFPKRKLTIKDRYYRTRAKWYRINRLLFPSPAEMRLIELMGGKVWRVKRVRHPATKFPFAIVISMGRWLGDEKFKREVRVGKYYIDFGNDVAMGLEVDGKDFHRDIVAEFDRDVYLREYGWRMYHIDAARLWNNPDLVQREVLKFLTY